MKMKKIYVLFGVLFGLTIFLLLSVVFLRVYYLERNVPKYKIEQWVETHEIHRVLVIFAHQDDELLVAGTLAGLDAADVETVLFTITNGDGEKLDEKQSIDDLVKKRAAALNAVADALRVDAVEQGIFSDKGFMDVSDDEIKQVILEKIRHYQPDTIITWDTAKGLYGHIHHVRIGQLVVELCRENDKNPEFPVDAVYGTTVSVWIREALKKLSPFYQKKYYEISDGESIEPEFSLDTLNFAENKREAFAVYADEKIIQSLNPLSGFPIAIQNFVFDREYFYQSY